MAVVSMNNLVQKIKDGYIFDLPVVSTGTPTNIIKQGELVYWDATNKNIKSLDSDANAATFLGVADDQYPINSNIDNGTVAGANSMSVGFNNIYSFKTTAGDTYVNFSEVYIGADSQTITNTAGAMTHKIGYIKLPSGVTSVAGGAGVSVPVYIYSKHPEASY